MHMSLLMKSIIYIHLFCIQALWIRYKWCDDDQPLGGTLGVTCRVHASLPHLPTSSIWNGFWTMGLQQSVTYLPKQHKHKEREVYRPLAVNATREPSICHWKPLPLCVPTHVSCRQLWRHEKHSPGTLGDRKSPTSGPHLTSCQLVCYTSWWQSSSIPSPDQCKHFP